MFELMEHESREKQTPIKFRRRKILSDEEKSSDASPAAMKNIELGAGDDSENTNASPTPEKSDRRISSRGKQLHEIQSEALVPELTLKFTQFPEKLKSLADLFDRMISSVRLLGLKKRLPYFRNISTQVEIMTRRKFSYGHLAQMIYVFPDAIQIEKVLVHDERTLCMIPDLKVNILFDIRGCHSYPGHSTSMALCLAFRVRLLEQLNSYQDAEIPEAVLPEPFNQKKDNKYLNSLSEELHNELPQQFSVELDSFSSVSHFSSYFRKQFCEKIIVPEAEQTKILASTSLAAIPDDTKVKTSKSFDKTSLPDVKYFSKAIYIPSHDQLVERTPVKGASTAFELVDELIDIPGSCTIPQSIQSTPAYDDLIAVDVIAETPVMQTPKRPVMSPVEILVSMNEKTVNEPKSTSSVRRTLIYSPQKLDMCISKLDFDTGEQMQTCEATAGSIEAQKFNQSNSEKRQALLNCLPAMFDTINFICQSVNCSLITKQELVHKIISNSLDIEETSEVEEQLSLLEELVPDWMCKKSTCNGELLYCIKRVPDSNTVRVRLSEAK